MKISTVFFLLIFVCLQVKGQDNDNREYLPLGIGVSFYQSKDDYQSPLRYRGFVPQIHLGQESADDNSIDRGRAIYRFGKISNHAKYPGKMNLNQFSYRQSYVHNVASDQQLNVFVGATLKINFASRSANRSKQFDAQATLAITGACTYKNDPADRWFYESSLSLPLLGWGMRPRFASSNYILPEKDYKGPAHYFIGFPKYFDLDFNLMAYWEMETGNLLRMDYRWWFYDMKYGHRVRSMEHGLNVGLMTRLK
jgi:hypothetical protein